MEYQALSDIRAVSIVLNSLNPPLLSLTKLTSPKRERRVCGLEFGLAILIFFSNDSEFSE
jgi:hypothetical protein